MPRLAIVVITRNEAKHIRACLEPACAAAGKFPGTPVVVVDSSSEDDTTALAAGFPVEVFRYRSRRRTAAAGRAIGTRLVRAEYVLFIDGDSCIEPIWVENAVQYLDHHPRVGVVYGQRRELLEGVDEDFCSRVPDDPGLGGTALYRSFALALAGGFHPHLAAEEEGELRARIEQAGFSVHQTPELMFTHRTIPKDTWRGFEHRVRRSMFSGYGQVLRAARASGLAAHHARRLNRQIITAFYLLAGLASLAAWAVGMSYALPLAWLGLGLSAFLLLSYRRRDPRAAGYIVCDWLFGAIGLIIGLLSPLPGRTDFHPDVEHLHPEQGRLCWESVEWRP